MDRVKSTEGHGLSTIIEQIPVCPDEEYEVLLLDKAFLEHVKTLSEHRFLLFPVANKKLKIQSMAQNDMILLDLSHVDSSWEQEIKTSRMLRKIYEQDCTLRYIENSVEHLNKILSELRHDRMDIIAENIYINLFLLTLRQEYIILREHEEIENVLHEKLHRNIEEITMIKEKVS